MASAASLSPGFWASGLIILDRKILTVSLSQTDKYEDVIKIIYQKKMLHFAVTMCHLSMEDVSGVACWYWNIAGKRTMVEQCLSINLHSVIVLSLFKLFQSTNNTILTRTNGKIYQKTLYCRQSVVPCARLDFSWNFSDYFVIIIINFNTSFDVKVLSWKLKSSYYKF